jgi:hypothetical protein
MVDLIVPAGTVLIINQASQVEPQYGLFRMEANAKIVASIDLTIKAGRAEFAEGCVIDASGAAGADGNNGASGAVGQPGTNGLPGQNGRNVVIEAGLAKIGGLTIITNGGAGGRGGAGGSGSLGGLGGGGGSGGRGGDAGQISLVWTRLAANLPSVPGTSPPGHVYSSNGGFGGSGGAGGQGGIWGVNGATGANGKSLPVQVTWRANPATLLWVQKQDMGPAPRAYHDIAFDLGRERLVLFGGLAAGSATRDTWEWDGQLWVQVADTGPAPRAYHAMAYDSARQRTLLFGGSDGGPVAAGAQGQGQRAYFGDTWAWDGQDWVQLADTGPSARQSHAMACDIGRSRVVLFSGGQISSQAANVAVADTWEWNGLDWAQVADSGPAARLSAKLAAVPGGVLLFGGTGVTPAALGDTWTWDGHQWLQVADTGPAPRIGHAMAADGFAVFLFGGQRLDGSPQIVNDTWAWYDQIWRQIQDIGPSPRAGHAMANVTNDSDNHITLYGGEVANAFGDTWRLEDRS